MCLLDSTEQALGTLYPTGFSSLRCRWRRRGRVGCRSTSHSCFRSRCGTSESCVGWRWAAKSRSGAAASRACNYCSTLLAQLTSSFIEFARQLSQRIAFSQPPVFFFLSLPHRGLCVPCIRTIRGAERAISAGKLSTAVAVPGTSNGSGRS